MSRSAVQRTRDRLRAAEDELTRTSMLLSAVGEFAQQRDRGAPADADDATAAAERFLAPGPMDQASRRRGLAHLREPFKDGNDFFALARNYVADNAPTAIDGDPAASIDELVDDIDDFEAGDATERPAVETFGHLLAEGSPALLNHLVAVVSLAAESARAARDRHRAALNNDYPDDADGGEQIADPGLVQEYVDARKDPIKDLGEHPIALLPVKLETRFARPPDGEEKSNVANPELYADMDAPELWVRIYPDAVHIDNHEPQLTDDEVRLGKDFWAYCWYATHEQLPIKGDPERERQYLAGHLDDRRTDVLAGLDPGAFPTDPVDRKTRIKERAWNQLLDRFGKERAAYVVHRMAPESNAQALASLTSSDGSAGDDEETGTTERFGGVKGRTASPVDGIRPIDGVPALSFPDPERKPDAWTRPPMTRLLPDQWLVYGIWEGPGESDPHKFLTTTDAVRDPLPVGPAPGQVAMAHPDRGDPAEADDDEALSWQTDFGAAERAGIAFRVTESDVFGEDETEGWPTLTDGHFDVLVVTGVKSSMDHERTATELRRLFEAHHYTDGLELLEIGTPTNNYERTSGYSSADDPTDSMTVETSGTPLVTHGDNSDGDRLARALGIDPDTDEPHVFGRVKNAGKTEWLDGWHMRSALWPATAGYYLSNMLVPNAFAGTRSLWDDDAEMPTVGDARKRLEWFESYRSHFINYVSPYGPLSSFRVDTQPYGVLPVTPLADERADVYQVNSDHSFGPPAGVGDGILDEIGNAANLNDAVDDLVGEGGLGSLIGEGSIDELLDSAGLGDLLDEGDVATRDLITAIAEAVIGGGPADGYGDATGARDGTTAEGDDTTEGTHGTTVNWNATDDLPLDWDDHDIPWEDDILGDVASDEGGDDDEQ